MTTPAPRPDQGRPAHPSGAGSSTSAAVPILPSGAVVGPYPPHGVRFVTASGWQRTGRYTVDVLTLLVASLPVMLLGFGLVEAVAPEAAAAGLPAGYVATALGYGLLAGLTRSVGERVAGVRRIRLRDGRPAGPLAAAARMLLVALGWPVVVLCLPGMVINGGPNQGGRFAAYAIVRWQAPVPPRWEQVSSGPGARPPR